MFLHSQGPRVPRCCVGPSRVKCLAQEHLVINHCWRGESCSFAFFSQISTVRVDYGASLKQRHSAALLACNHVRSYTNIDIPEPLEVPRSCSTCCTGIYDPPLIKESLLVIKPPDGFWLRFALSLSLRSSPWEWWVKSNTFHNVP